METTRATPFRVPQARLHGIVLAGSFPWSDSPLDRLMPRPLLPIAHEPLISYALRWLKHSGVGDVTVCLNRASRAARAVIEEGAPDGLGLEFYEDASPRGPAGCARDAALASSADAFVVVDGNAIPTAVLADLLHTHRNQAALATVLVQQQPLGPGNNCLSRPCGVYIFERRALETVPERGFQDIKENLIPRLYRSDEHVAAHIVTARSARVLNITTYLDTNHWAVARLLEHPEMVEGYVLSGEALIHRAASVDSAARIVGPVLIGPDSKIVAGAILVGPVVLGAGCAVAADAFVSRTVAWNRCLVGVKAVVDGCVLADDATVEANARLTDEVKFPPRRREVLGGLSGARSAGPFALWPRPRRVVR
jgi:NDP-sugar pyrophosphorylase family protein